MNKFVTGLLIGVGIGWLTAPKQGKEMRRMVGERWQAFRGYSPDNAGVNQIFQQVTDSFSQISRSRGELLQMVTNLLPKDYESTLGDLAKMVASKMGDRKFTVNDLSRLASWLAKQAGQFKEEVS
jgi:gas vesicle protein